jgi:hypothetical protein
MKPSLHDSPAKFVLLAVVGCLIASILFLAPEPRDAYDTHRVAAFLIGFGIFAAGAFLALKSTTNLRNGVENQRWPDSQIEPFRRHFESPAYTALSIALFIAFVLFEFLFRRSLGGEGWACFLFLQTLSQIRIALKRPREKISPVQWNNFSPIHSDHWGER